MSVLIKGMKMPSCCMNCHLSVLNGERLWCKITREEVLRAKIAPECPLEESSVRPKGKWMFESETEMFQCSKCKGMAVRNDYPFCHWCGTEMEKKE